MGSSVSLAVGAGEITWGYELSRTAPRAGPHGGSHEWVGPQVSARRAPPEGSHHLRRIKERLPLVLGLGGSLRPHAREGSAGHVDLSLGKAGVVALNKDGGCQSSGC